MRYFNLIFFLLLPFVGLLFPRSEAIAQRINSGIATYIQVIDDPVQEGDIIKFTEKGYALTRNAYEPSVFGVVVADPSISFETANTPNAKPVVSSGKVYVRVSTINGEIKKGDLISTSNYPGIGQKATETGYIIGTALDNYSASNPTSVGRILVQLNISFNSVASTGGGNLIEVLRVGLSSPFIAPLNALRYILAIGLILLSFVLGLNYFGKISRTGVEAVGRNPLAAKFIVVSIAVNVLMGLGVIFVALTLAYFILIV